MSDFVDYVTGDVLAAWAPVEARAMFGGHGLYRDGTMFALIADDVLYLKADAESAACFDALDLAPFEYVKKGRVTTMSYRQAPESVFDDADEAALWADRAWEAARRAGRGRR